ncbi:PQQ-like beta-propeller repeat protein [Sulfitobacter sp. JB4-11]|uniref:PQQ-like beta-propeller repeat protein n=1 Tax=Sulfitobacter rhodophyticola TaxID=3238304 RepID=UPI003512E24C
MEKTGRTVNQHPRFGKKALLAALICGTWGLAACDGQETYLPGLRENVRSVLQDPLLSAPLEGTEVPENTSQPISLPAASTNASWTHSPGTPQYRTAHPALRSVPQLVWSADIGAGDSRKQRITAAPVVSGGRVFTLDAGARVTATSNSGAVLWSRDLTPPADKEGQGTGGGLAVDGKTVYVSVGFGLLTALDVETGGLRWQQDLDASGTGTPTVYGDLVYVTAGDDSGWALRKTDGKIEWQVGASASVANVLGAPAPAVTDQYAIFGFGSGEVRAVFRRGGVARWDASVVGKRPGRALSSLSDVTSAPVVSGDTVYVGNQSGRLAALSVDSGNARWTAREGAVRPVWPVGGSVFAITDQNELVRLDAGDGSRIWGVPLEKFVKDKPKRQSEVFAHHGPVVAGGRVVVASNNGVLRSFDPVNGALVGAVEIPGGATTDPVIAGGTLYVVSTKGQLHAFR